jgi:putative hydrolase of HD superfamily
MNADAALRLLLRVVQMKFVPRTGWVMRGIADAESISDHTFGVTFITLILAQMTDQPVDTVKLLTLALLHDLPEVALSDIPSPASDYLPAEAKVTAEREALSALLDQVPQREAWQAWWRELEEGTSIEGRLVGDADRLDMLLQAHVYEQTTGNRWLGEFWEDVSRDSFACQASRSLFDALWEVRRRGEGGHRALD